jgi:AraC family ethanolamine operon transcriptional activator
MEVEVGQFADIQLHAASIREWSQVYSQLTPGLLRSSLLQVRGARFELLRESINQRVVQQGEAPRDRICFTLPLHLPGAAHMQGCEADVSSLLLLRGGEEFTFHTPMCTDLVSITIEQSSFDRVISSISQPDELDRLLKQPVLKLPVARAADARRRLLRLFEVACAASHSSDFGDIEDHLEHALTTQIVQLLTDQEFDRHQVSVGSPSGFIVDKSHQLTIADGRNPLKVLDICRKLRVSRRSVQNGFQSVVEMTPVKYMRCVRLNGVRRALLETSADELSIGDAAARWGFLHLSHFAAQYRALFGELPSKTSRAQQAGAREANSPSSSVHPAACVPGGLAPEQYAG